ncbi:hypothetical protein [Polycladidibacter hongkongensis]|uniref:hypothetical protein n=1 Tax=Polycladidibacter hongkongensis TaxID=1647556 RepID=UPI00083548E2|nr:hypothetical protein [Pseudovibrio hongkongensis]
MVGTASAPALTQGEGTNRAWQALALFAGRVSRPMSFVHDHNLQAGELPLEALHSLSGDPEFAVPLQRLISAELGLSKLRPALLQSENVDPSELPARLVSMLIASQPREAFAELCRLSAIASFQKRISAVLLKQQRARLLALFGENVFDLALRELAFFFPALAMEADWQQRAFMLICGEDEDAALQALNKVGASALLGFIQSVDPALVPLISLRFGKEQADELRELAVQFDATQQQQFTQFLLRRVPEWQSYIA